MSQDAQNINQTVNYASKNSNKGLIIGIVIGGVIACLLAIITVVLLFNAINKKKFYGEWICDDGINVVINDKNFNMFIDSQTKIESTYKIVSNKNDGVYRKYDIEATAKKRIIDGQEYTSPYTTKYQIIMNNSSDDELSMINSLTYNMYSCQRKK